MQWRWELILTICSVRIKKNLVFFFPSFCFLTNCHPKNTKRFLDFFFFYISFWYWFVLWCNALIQLLLFFNLSLKPTHMNYFHDNNNNVIKCLWGRIKRFQSELFYLSFCSQSQWLFKMIWISTFSTFLFITLYQITSRIRRRNREKLNNLLVAHRHTQWRTRYILLSKRIDNSKWNIVQYIGSNIFVVLFAWLAMCNDILIAKPKLSKSLLSGLCLSLCRDLIIKCAKSIETMMLNDPPKIKVQKSLKLEK